MKTRYGGQLQPGDVIAISNGNYLHFGWYFGKGRGTVQYFPISSPGDWFEDFDKWKNGNSDINNWRKRRFEKYGFSSKLFYKAYIHGETVDSGTRIMKLDHPESVFTNPEDLEAYNKSKEALLYIKFLNK